MQVTTENLTFSQENPRFLLTAFLMSAEENVNLQQKLEVLEKTFAEENADLKKRLEQTENMLHCLIEQIKLSKQRHFGKKSEAHLGLVQMELQFDIEKEAEVEEPKEAEKEEETISSYTRKKAKVGRKIDTSKLPREVMIHDLAESEKHCKCCGKELETQIP